MKLLVYPDKRLSRPAQRVTSFDRELHRSVQEVSYAVDCYNFRHLSAPQLGIDQAFFIFTDEQDMKRVVINPQFSDISDEKGTYIESCASFPNHVFRDVVRPVAVTISGIDFVYMKPVKYTASGSLARVFLHEIDHLNGVLPTDYYDSQKLDEFEKLWKMMRQKNSLK